MTKEKKHEKLAIVYKPLNLLIAYARNARLHSDDQVKRLADSVEEFGWTNPILIDEAGEIIAGHGRVMAADLLVMTEVPCIILPGLNDAQKKAYRLADNKLPLHAGWDNDLLAMELAELLDADFDLMLTGFEQSEIDDLFSLGDPGSELGNSRVGNMAEKFLVPPFTVLNAREGWWQERKQAWISIGIQSEQGRSEDLLFGKSTQSGAVYDKKNAYEATVGKKVSWNDFLAAHPDLNTLPTTSIFDPVMCELAYRWFSPPQGVVLDPFAGGSVRGVVATKLGRLYRGCDLRAEQVEANRQQWGMMKSLGPPPE